LHFLDCFQELFSARIARGHLSAAAVEEVQSDFELGRRELLRVREEFYTALDTSWEFLNASLATNGSFDTVHRTSHALAAAARQWVDRLYPFAGLAAAHVDSEINQVWRDLHTASQHPLLVF
jgi:hypothetical protein